MFTKCFSLTSRSSVIFKHLGYFLFLLFFSWSLSVKFVINFFVLKNLCEFRSHIHYIVFNFLFWEVAFSILGWSWPYFVLVFQRFLFLKEIQSFDLNHDPQFFLDFRILSKEAKSEPKVFVAQMVRGLHRRYRSFSSLLQMVILGWLVNRSVSLKKKSKIAPSTTTPFKDTHAAEPQSLIRSLFVCIFSQELRFE